MEDAFALVVLTLLQLCRAEISNTEWYAANLINDPSYTPKPLNEIFTTDLTFTPKNPTLSTQFTTRTTPSTTTISTTISTSTDATTTYETTNFSTQQGQAPRIPLQIVPVPQQPQIISQVSDSRNSLPSFLLIFDPRQQSSPAFQQPLNTSPTTTTTTQSTMPETKPPMMPTETPPTTNPPRPSTQSNTQTNTRETTIVPRNLQPQTIPISPPTSFIPGRWDVTNIVYPIPNFPIYNTGCNSTTAPNNVMNSTITPQPARNGSSKPILTVRVKSAKGSITNILINPTTTHKPTTTRRRKANKRTNDYEICLNSCDGKKEPICSSPIGVFPINPDKLKGFASLCHMACHNSFRKDQVYDKVADGRCGRLRTRIRPVDKNKLNREELNKAQYTILHNGPETVVELSPLKR